MYYRKVRDRHCFKLLLCQGGKHFWNLAYFTLRYMTNGRRAKQNIYSYVVCQCVINIIAIFRILFYYTISWRHLVPINNIWSITMKKKEVFLVMLPRGVRLPTLHLWLCCSIARFIRRSVHYSWLLVLMQG